MLFPAGAAVNTFPASFVQFTDDGLSDEGLIRTFDDFSDKFVPHGAFEIRTVAFEDLPVRTADIGIKDPDQALIRPAYRQRQVFPVMDFFPVKV